MRTYPRRLDRIGACLVFALALMAAGAEASPSQHCAGVPEWDARYAALDDYDHLGGEAREWFVERGCLIEGDDPVCPETVPCAVAAPAPAAWAQPPADREASEEACGDSCPEVAAAPAPPASGCRLPPALMVSPLTAPVGTAITGTLLDRETSRQFRITPERRAAWAVTPGKANMAIDETDRTRSTYTVRSTSPGRAAIVVSVCGESLRTSVSWTRPWWKHPVVLIGIAGGAAVAVIGSRRGAPGQWGR